MQIAATDLLAHSDYHPQADARLRSLLHRLQSNLAPGATIAVAYQDDRRGA